MTTKTSIIILTYNNLEDTILCIESIRKYTPKDTYDLIVIDNASSDDTRNWLLKQKDITVILNKENKGFPKGCNEGIKISPKENEILLLNNDTIVTENWLTNLKICLYSNDNIGAVGAVSNHSENLQGCNFTYETIEQMHNLAKENNKSNEKRWEEKVFLIGYCLLIKRCVIDSIIELDESFTPGYIEDNDLSLQIVKLGYRLMLCHDAFIHHKLGTGFRKDLDKFNQLITKNRKIFEQKWHFSTFAFDETKNASIFLAQKTKDILDYNCGIGASSLKIKYQFPNAKITGYDKDPNKLKIAKNFIPVVNNLKKLKKKKFDTIFIGNALEHVENPFTFLEKIKSYLKPNGTIIGEISNIANIDNLNLLLKNEWYYTNYQKKNNFTKKDIETIFYSYGFSNPYIFSWIKELNSEEEKILKDLNIEKDINWKTTYYSFRFSYYIK